MQGGACVEKLFAIGSNTTILPDITMEAGATVVASGTYNDVTWTLNSDGLLTVSGSGAINDAQWIVYKGQVKELVLESGIQYFNISTAHTYVDGVRTEGYVNLTHIRISDTVTSFKINASRNNFEMLEAYEVSENNQYYSSIDGVLYNKDQSTLIRYPVKREGTSFSIPNTVKAIEADAFYGCSWVFGCALTSITLPESLETVGDYAFYQTAIGSLVLPETVTALGEGAFQSDQLTSVYIPAKLVSIGAQALSGNQLTTITVSESNPAYTAVENVLFLKDMTTLVLYPEGKSGESYQVPQGVTTIGDYAFYDCRLTTLYIPDSVTTVGAYSMYSFYNLTGVYFYGDVPESWAEKVLYGTEVTIYYISGKNGWTEPTWTDPNGNVYPSAVWNP